MNDDNEKPLTTITAPLSASPTITLALAPVASRRLYNITKCRETGRLIYFLDWDMSALWVLKDGDERIVKNVKELKGMFLREYIPTISGAILILERSFEAYYPAEHNDLIQYAKIHNVIIKVTKQRMTGDMLYDRGFTNKNNKQACIAIADLCDEGRGIHLSDPSKMKESKLPHQRQEFERVRRAKVWADPWVLSKKEKYPLFESIRNNTDIFKCLSNGKKHSDYNLELITWLSTVYEECVPTYGSISDRHLHMLLCVLPGFHRAQFCRRASTLAANEIGANRNKGGYMTYKKGTCPPRNKKEKALDSVDILDGFKGVKISRSVRKAAWKRNANRLFWAIKQILRQYECSAPITLPLSASPTITKALAPNNPTSSIKHITSTRSILLKENTLDDGW